MEVMIQRLKIIIACLILLVFVFVGYAIAHLFISTTYNTTAVVKQIQALNRWETASFTMEKIIDSGTSGNIFQQFLFGNKILLIAHGEVIAGFDLSGFSEKDITMNGSDITITLPSPQTLIAKIDPTKTKVYDKQQGILVVPDNNLELNALASAQKSIRDGACTEGILDIASANAKTVLTSILSAYHFKNITIVVPPGHCSP